MPAPDEIHEEKKSPSFFDMAIKRIIIIAVLIIGLIAMPFIFYYHSHSIKSKEKILISPVTNIKALKDTVAYWIAADINNITDPVQKKVVKYGKDLIAHTAKYLGPKGSVSHTSNGMSCQNCHLQAGTAVFGNNYGSVASLYPKFRARSGTIENVYKRVNDCFERSLNGKAIDTAGEEMQAIVSYINFIGSNVGKGKKASGSGLKDLKYLDRAADPERGKSVFTKKCQSCHQSNGQGVFNDDKTEFIFPALWGKNSFNDAAGLYRITNMARYVKFNMPNGATYKNPVLTDEEAWDVAAFILMQPRPHHNVPNDWPDISKKPVDQPFGPYEDAFTEKQHKFGPFKPITDAQKKKNN